MSGDLAMANRLAGQRAKFSRAKALYYSSPEGDDRGRAVRLMAEVLADAPGLGFTEDEVTQLAEVPEEVRRAAILRDRTSEPELPDAEEIALLGQIVDVRHVIERGEGEQSVYAYGYACAPDRLKIGSAMDEPVARVAAQISTATPDRPVLRLVIRTHDCRALERAFHNILRLKGRKVQGAGAEWFRVTIEEVLDLYERVFR